MNSQDRKNTPIANGALYYFPDAIAAVARVSKKGNDKHNPGEPLHWSREKSSDHADCVARHLVDAGKNWTNVDPETGELHAAALAWRALAMLQIALEKVAALQPVEPPQVELDADERDYFVKFGIAYSSHIPMETICKVCGQTYGEHLGSVCPRNY